MTASSIDYVLRVEEAIDDATPTDVVVGVGPSHTVADLTAALRNHLGASGAAAILVDGASGEIFEPATPVVRSGLTDGATVRLAPANSRSRPAAARPDPAEAGTAGVELVVRSGPDAVTSRGRLGAGRILVGRDRGCDLVLRDPGVSRVHAEVDSRGDGTIMISPSAEAQAPVTVDGAAIDGPVPLKVGSLVRLGHTTLGVRSVPAPGPEADATATTRVTAAAERRSDVGGRVAFHRTPYYPAPVEKVVFDALGTIPEEAEPARFAYLTAAAPLLLGMTMALAYSPRFLLFAAFSPLVAVAAYFEQRRRTARRRRRALSRHQRHLDDRNGRITTALARERSRRHQGAPDLAELAWRAETRGPELWVRDRRAADVLRLRLGLGDTESAVSIARETRGEDQLRDELHAELDQVAVLRDVPVVVDLGQRAALALVGADDDTTALAASLVCQAACLHSPEDLVIAAATDGARGMADWMKWLPHVRAPSSPLEGGHLAETTAQTDELLRALLETAEARSADGDPRLDRRWPRLLVVLDRRLEPDPTVVSRLIELAPGAGIAAVWLTSSADRVPRQAEVVVTCRSLLDHQGSVVADTDPAVGDAVVDIDRLDPAGAQRIARDLASVRDASSATAASALPRVVTLLEALGAERVDQRWVASRWRADRGGALVLPLGMSTSGPLLVDLVGSGPHGLLGGTSGAGKSELLTSMVAGLVALNPPDRANVLFIDYKGGALADQFTGVPHVVGSVTNLDAFLARRALTSLRAELDRRMTLLQGRAKDLTEMVARHPAEAPPSLVLVVDEFATLVKEIPEFIAGIVDIAQRGRSLGIHLLLATQRPTGAVNENILANTNLRISLRMVDTGESRSVIGTDDAATIPVPLRGRGFVRLGPGQLTAFQAPWAAAPGPDDNGPSPVTVRPFGPRRVSSPSVQPSSTEMSSDRPGSAQSPPPGVATAPGPDGPSQLTLVLGAVIDAAGSLGLRPGPAPWHDELPRHLTLDAVRAARHPTPARAEPGERDDDGWWLPLGLVDDPQAQAQYPAVIDLAGGGGLAVFGTGGSGRTTVLRTLAAAAALDQTEQPEAGATGLTIFGLDFASRELTALPSLASCSAVATGDDLEAVTRIVALLDQELEQRRRASAEANERGLDRPPDARILLLIDDYGNLSRTFEGPGAAATLYPWLDTLNRIIVDGRQVGIHTALTAARRSSVKSSILSAMANRIVLRQTDAGGYTELGLPGSLVADLDLPPGRGFLNGTDQLQVAVLAESAGGARPARRAGGPEREALGLVITRTAGHRHPEAMATRALPMAVRPVSPGEDPGSVVVGVADLTLAEVRFDLRSGPVCILGGPRSGRSNALAVITRQVAASGRPLWMAGPAGAGLADLGPAVDAGRSSFGSLSSVVDLLEALASTTVDGQTGQGARSVNAPLLAIDDLDLLEDPALDNVAGRLVAAGVGLVATASTMRGYTTNPLVQEIRKARTILHLQPADAREVQEMTGSHPRIRPGLAMVPGRGVLVVNRYPTVVQVAGPVLDRGPESR